ncbi:Conserved_hypothetical protein [Hexamita inflata]|uniref:Transmembrane protein n=1 Tax=Hexamita inflata TaxID=28002 RepID=A0AA86PJ75_9EUKA|nr:Conserved hypothetical protein [Hexamita inflata]
MIHFCVILSLVCFQTNVTVSLDVQTRSLIFKAWPRTDSSTELNVCKQMSGDLYKLSIQTGAYTYALSQLQTYGVGATIDITIPCEDLIDNCATAFKATSAIYIMEFQNANVVVNEAAQNLRRVDFNRKNCVQNPQLQFGQNIQITPGVYSNEYKLSGTPTQICKYPLDTLAVITANVTSTKKAVLSFQAYPNFTTTSQLFSVSLPTIFSQATYPCATQSTPTAIAWCNNMTNSLATQSFGYNRVQYFAPGKIPNKDGTITRAYNYSVSYETNVVTNTLQSTFDCYSSQNIMLYSNTLLLTNTMNPAINYCNTTMSSFIGFAYDKVVTRVIFQEFEDFRKGNVYILDFNTKSQVLNSSSEWLDCDLSTNISYCKEVLAKQSVISKYQFSAQQLIYKNDVLLKIFTLSPSLSVSCLQDVTAYIYDTQACVNVTNICSNTTQNQQLIISFKNQQSYINISTLAEFPNSEGRYCANSVFKRKQTGGITSGIVQIGSSLVPISSLTDETEVLEVANIQYLVLGIAVFVGIFVAVGIFKPLV